MSRWGWGCLVPGPPSPLFPRPPAFTCTRQTLMAGFFLLLPYRHAPRTDRLTDWRTCLLLASSPWPGMGLRESPYANSFLRGLNAVAQDLLFPTYWLLSQLLALQQTTAEKQARRPCPPHTLLVLTKGPVILLLLVLSAPFLLLGLVVWLPLQTVRRPFAYQHTPSQAPQPQEWMLPGKGRSFTFLCANLCLMPDGLAKFSNLAHTQWRAKRIALGLGQAASRSFLPDEPSARGRIQNGLGTPNGQKYGATGDSPPRACQGLPRAAAADVAITMPFREEEKASGLGQIVVPFPPNVDFVCLQEVFDQRATTRMRQLLGPWYEHIVYDVGVYGLYGCSAFKVLNSGLFLASRYPVLAVQYHCYPNGAGEDSFAAKGLLCVQVSQCQQSITHSVTTRPARSPERDPAACSRQVVAHGAAGPGQAFSREGVHATVPKPSPIR